MARHLPMLTKLYAINENATSFFDDIRFGTKIHAANEITIIISSHGVIRLFANFHINRVTIFLLVTVDE